MVALGSNLSGEFPSRHALLEAAVARFAGARLPILRRSGWWRSPAWPDPSRPDYLNGVALVETALGPAEVMACLLALEAAFGRRRGEVNAPRTLDLDLIAHGRRVMDEPGLTLPHPRAHERLFVMGPLAQIAPAWVHPISGEAAKSLAERATVGWRARLEV